MVSQTDEPGGGDQSAEDGATHALRVHRVLRRRGTAVGEAKELGERRER